MEDDIKEDENKSEILTSTENNSQNTINVPEEKDIEKKKDDNDSKYKIKYTKILEFVKSREDDKYKNENEFFCTILLMPSKIELSNKISTLSYLCNSYLKNKKFELIYGITRKFDKCLDSLNAIEPSLIINVYIKVANHLNEEFGFLYSYKFVTKIKNYIKKNSSLINKKYNLRELNKLLDDIKTNVINFIMKYKSKFMSDEYFPIEKAYEVKKLIDALIADKYEIESEDQSKDDYLYAVNREWILKTKIFIENYIKAKEQKIQAFFEEAFDPNYVYTSYFNEKSNKKRAFSAFPGPMNNYEITSFKDHWIDYINLDENDIMKKGVKYKEDYYLIKKNDWKLLKTYFDKTNEILRKRTNLDLIQLKFILFDQRIDSDYKNTNLLKEKYILINQKSSIKQIKDKLIKITHYNFQDIEDENVKKNDMNKQITFYILDKNKSNVLIEMCFSYIIGISLYDSLFIEKLELKDENTLDDLFKKYDKKKHILIIEITDLNEDNYFVDLKKEMNKEYKCTICKKKINSLKDKYNCEICEYSLFCSKQCAEESKDHIRLDDQLCRIKEKKFSLPDLLSTSLESILKKDSNYGRVGLYNMGNTCYFNSALQCLSNTEDLTKYFINKCWEKEINNGSSLGSKGFISKEYYKFINKMWNEPNNRIAPKEFRINFCRKTGLFLNSEQQDSQEFLLAVLDNLHEDLNRITNKKYMELQEQQKGESDESASKRWWDYYLSRENSIIVDLFQGQFKSTIQCSICGNSSISYDTYMNLGLPIPTIKTSNQIKLLTSDQNFIDINVKINDNIALKDVIKKAINYLNKTKYIDYIKNTKNENVISTNSNSEIPEKVLYNNIKVIEFSKGFKINNIYKTAFENININYNSKDNMKQPLFDNLKLNVIYKNNNNSEFILYENELNIDPQNYYDVYIYPLTEKTIEGFISDSIKKIILSYPILIQFHKDRTLEELESLIHQKLQKILDKRAQPLKSIEICFPHFTKSWGKFKINKGECPLCKSKYDKQKKYCSLFKSIPKNKKISDLMSNLKGRPLIIYAKSQQYNSKEEVYSGIPLFNENSKKKDKKLNFTIYDSFDCFNQKEILEGDNMWYCNKCKKHNIAVKKIEIYRTPLYLIIQLKRFRHRSGFFSSLLGNKNETYVEYKEVLNIKDFVVGPDKDKSIYNLYGVIIHKKFMNGGHYYAYCKNRGLWITYDDQQLSICHNPIDKDAYLLFYKRKNYD